MARDLRTLRILSCTVCCACLPAAVVGPAAAVLLHVAVVAACDNQGVNSHGHRSFYGSSDDGVL